MQKVILGLGSNMNDPLYQLDQALEQLQSRFGNLEVSSYFTTEPIGGPAQPDFVNAAASMTTDLPPADLLKILQQIEFEQGRLRDGLRNHPRPLDLDIIFYGDQILLTPDLTVPHPRYQERRFVLEPLDDLDPQFRDPVTGLTVHELLMNCSDQHRVNRLETELIP